MKNPIIPKPKRFSLRAIVITLSCVFQFAGPSFAAETNKPPQFSILSLLPKGTIEVDVLGLNPPKNIQDLYYKKMVAMKQNSTWLKDFLRTNVSSGPMPFNTNFGLTEAEHAELRSYKPRLVKVAEGRLRAAKDKDDTVTLSGGTRIAEMAQVKVDPNTMSVSTPFGILSSNDLSFDNAPDGAVGAWSGYRWSLTEQDQPRGRLKHLEFLLGKLANTNQVFINYSVRMRHSYDEPQTANIEIAILFPFAGSSSKD